MCFFTKSIFLWLYGSVQRTHYWHSLNLFSGSGQARILVRIGMRTQCQSPGGLQPQCKSKIAFYLMALDSIFLLLFCNLFL